MSISLGLLSGKGGSGKTSLALTLSSLLSYCEIKVLIIDCDLATNGMAYFFESQISSDPKRFSSFSKIIEECKRTTGRTGVKYIEENKYLNILPSISEISESSQNSIDFKDIDLKKLGSYLDNIESKYDVIIYDFQSGYTELLNAMIPHIDNFLFVIEADAISSSSLRALYLKIGSMLEKKKVYQVFNKATEEEYKIYSKLYTGTLFPNIETIRFDWEIRKAFSLANVPSIENCSYQYMEQVINIAKHVFNREEIKTKLRTFDSQIELKRIETEEKKIQEKIEAIENFDASYKNSNNKIRLDRLRNTFTIFMTAMTAMFIFVIVYQIINRQEGIQFWLELGLCIIALAIAVVTTLFFIRETVTKKGSISDEELTSLKKKLADTDKEKREVLEKIGLDKKKSKY